MHDQTDEHLKNSQSESDEGYVEASLLASNTARPHLAWAKYIKQYHYHLQRVFSSFLESSYQSHASGASGQGNVNNQSNNQSLVDELKFWQSFINSKEEGENLQEYARAMHCLATKYWEVPSVKLNSSYDSVKREEREYRADLSTINTPQVPLTAVGEFTHEILGQKRSRFYMATSKSDVNDEIGLIRSDMARQHHYDDRIQFCLDCVETFYLGHPCGTRKGNSDRYLFQTLPLVISRTLKPWKRDFFRKEARTATKSEIENKMLQLFSESGGTELSTSESSHLDFFFAPQTALGQAMRYIRLMQMISTGESTSNSNGCGDAVFSVPALHAIDVGSCYGPFFGKSFPHSVLGSIPLHTISLDLCPYRPSHLPTLPNGCAELSKCVWKGDWLSLAFFRLPISTFSDTALDANCSTPYLRFRDRNNKELTEEQLYVESVALESFDAVFFCLFLSYLPSARLRYYACVNAYLSLKEGGLLVVVSTRTQGSRRGRWVSDWVAAISSIGFSRTHQIIREKIVILCFEKKSNLEGRKLLNDINLSGEESKISDAVEAFRQKLNNSPYAANGLYVIADEDI